MVRFFLLASLAISVGCSSANSSDLGSSGTGGGETASSVTTSSGQGVTVGAATSTGSGGAMTTSADASTSSSAGGSLGGEGGGDATPSCYPACTQAADCAVPNTTLYDANHFACTKGACVWLGCQSDADCTYAGEGYKCGPDPSSPVPKCLASCKAVSDCAQPNDPTKSADNFSCDGGVCHWRGCQTDEECQAAANSTNVVCDASKGFPQCTQTCMQAADCATDSKLYDANNFTCEDGLCRWLGCMSDSECQQGLMMMNAVCR